MVKAMPAALSSGLVAKKGEAGVSGLPATSDTSFSQPLKENPLAVKTQPSRLVVYFKSLTLKLDRTRYMRLKQMGLDSDRKSQDILVEALDEYFSNH